MSRLARKPIIIPQGLKASYENNVLSITKGSTIKKYEVPESINLRLEDNTILCELTGGKKHERSLLGTTHVNIASIIIGLEKGFSVELQLVGIGYSVVQDGSVLVFNLGKSHQDRYEVSSDVKVSVPDKTNIVISGEDKQKVSDVADEIVNFRRPDVYKGKGVRYKNRQYKLKEVKK